MDTYISRGLEVFASEYLPLEPKHRSSTSLTPHAGQFGTGGETKGEAWRTESLHSCGER
jgi:hypothetical protein